MSTNYYKIIPLSEDIKQLMIESINNDTVYSDEDGTEFDMMTLPKTKYHIGKFSRGWKFLFDKNDGMFKSEKDIEDFVNGPGIIIDEYGSKIDNFWDIVEMTQKWPDYSDTEWKGIDYYIGKYRVSTLKNWF